ncbi:MAG: putative amidohydrolase YtcJ [Colwellia sp.]|jgi:predicted amidohydrolase YtcJ
MNNKPMDYRSSHAGVKQGKADKILFNGKLYTVNHAQPWAEAVAIKDGIIIALGTYEDMDEHIDPQTALIDLAGKFAMPGIYDMHTHPDLALAPGYAGYLDVGLESPTPEDVKQAILAYADENPGDGWIYGQYYVQFTFKKEGLDMGRDWLDSIISDRPVAILDRSWGTIMVNSEALRLADIDENTPDPNNGYIERDSITNIPTGILVDGGYALIHAAMPPTPMHALKRAYREGIQYQTGRGVVGTKYVHVCEHRLNAMKAIDDAGEMTLRIEAAISWQDDIFPVKRRWELIAGERHFYRSARLNANAVKFHFDGTHGAKSSYLATPYDNDTNWRGSLNMTPEHLNDMIIDMDRKGIRVVAHCTGDAASDLFLDAIENARKQGYNRMRHQCAHSTVLLDQNLPRFKALDVIAEFSPVGWYPFPFANARAESNGTERAKRLYNIKGVLDAGGIAVIGTDWPVSNINPWIGFEALITRQNPDKNNIATFYGDAITLEQAIRVMTINGAWSMGIEDKAGSLEVGKSADLIVLDRNLFEIEARGNIHNTHVDLTFLEGEIVWDRHGQFNDSKLQAVWHNEIPNFYDDM